MKVGKAVKILLKKAAEEKDSDLAIQWSQAALNVANALHVLEHIKNQKGE